MGSSFMIDGRGDGGDDVQFFSTRKVGQFVRTFSVDGILSSSSPQIFYFHHHFREHSPYPNLKLDF